MELKHALEVMAKNLTPGSNCTFMELKQQSMFV